MWLSIRLVLSVTESWCNWDVQRSSDEADHLPFKKQTSEWKGIQIIVVSLFFINILTCFFKSITADWNYQVKLNCDFYPLNPKNTFHGIFKIPWQFKPKLFMHTMDVPEPWQPVMRLLTWYGLNKQRSRQQLNGKYTAKQTDRQTWTLRIVNFSFHFIV